MNRWALGVIVAVSIPVQSGCASYRRSTAFHAAGWKVAYVNRIIDEKDSARSDPLPCIDGNGSAEVPEGRLAELVYIKGMRARGTLTVLIPQGMSVRVGQEVEVNVKDCTKPIKLHGASPTSTHR